MKPLLRSGVWLWTLVLLSALLEEVRLQGTETCDNLTTPPSTLPLLTTTTTVTLPTNCSIDSLNGNNGIDLTPGAVYQISINCSNCITQQAMTTQPEVVTNLTVTEVTTSSMVLNWTKPVGNTSFYKVQWTNGTGMMTLNTTTTSVNISSLTPGVLYTISVTAVADDGVTQGQNASVFKYTKPEVVTDLTVTEITTSFLFLNWIEPNGNHLFYAVQWADGTLSLNANITESEFNITGLTPGVQYTVTVITIAGDNQTQSDVAAVSNYTKPEAVTDLTVTEITTSFLFLNWIEPNGNHLFYTVQWTDGTLSLNANITESEFNITGLTPGVQYTVTVITIAGDNQTPSDVAAVSNYTKPEVVTDLTVTEVTTSFLLLNWTKPVGNSFFYYVQWTDGNSTYSQNVTVTYVKISNLTPGVQYNVTVITVAGDNQTQSEYAYAPQYTKPGQIVNLSINQSYTSISLSWTPPPGQVFMYSIGWSNGSTGNTFITNNSSAVLSNLSPGTNYTINIIAVAGDSQTKGDPYILWRFTKPEVVTDLTVTEVTTSFLLLNWTKSVGNSFFYYVQWTDGNSTNSQNVTVTYVKISNLTPGVQYNVTVITVAGDNQTQSEYAYAPQYTKPGQIVNLSINQSYTSISLSWTPPPGQVFMYSIGWSNGSTGNTFSTNNSSAVLSNLSPGTNYTINIIAVAGDSQTKGDPYILWRFTKPEVVTDLTVTEVTTSFLLLNWTKPVGNSFFYYVQWTDGNSTYSQNVTVTYVKISNLTPGVQYNVTVITVAGDNQTQSDVAAVSQYTKPEKVTHLSVTEVTKSILFLNWTKPVGNSFFYKVLWTDGNSTYSQNVTVTYVKISNLTPGVQYNVTVITVAGDNQTQSDAAAVSQYTSEIMMIIVFNCYTIQKDDTKSDERQLENITILVTLMCIQWYFPSLSCTFPALTEPEVVTNLIVTSFTTTILYVNWTKPVGNSFFYKVLWTDGNSTYSQNVTVTYVKISNLTPGVQYNVTVITVAGNNQTQSDVAAVSQYTKPEKVTDLSVAEVTTSILFLNWTKPVGNSFFYKVLWTDGNSTFSQNVTVTYVKISNLTPGVQYNVTVITVAGDNQTQSDVAAVSQYTKPEKVTDLSVAEVTTSILFLNWTKPVGNSFFYKVLWTDGNSTFSQNVTVTYVKISNLTPGVQYNVTVITVAGDNQTQSDAAAVSQYTKPEKVTDLNVTEVTTSILFLNWTKPVGNSFFYKVLWTDGNSTYSQNVTVTYVKISNLTPGVQYNVTVITIAGDNQTKSDVAAVSQYTKPEVVTDLIVTGFTTTILFVNWTKPVGNSSFYKVLWTDGNSTYSQNVTVTYVKISNLTPGVQYNVTVITVAGDNQTQSDVAAVSHYTSKMMMIVVLPQEKTKKEKTNYDTERWEQIVALYQMFFPSLSCVFPALTEPEKVTDLNVTEVTTSILFLNWTKPVGNSFFYKVLWTDGNSTYSQNVTVTYVKISNLTPGVQYNVTVITIARDNQTKSDVAAVSQYTSEMMRMIVFNCKDDTKSYEEHLDNIAILVTLMCIQWYFPSLSCIFPALTEPEVVTDLIVTGFTTTILFVNWTKPVGNSSFYKVLWTDGNSTYSQNVTVTYVKISNLTPGVQYNVTVITVAGDNQTQSDVAAVSHYTKPEKVTDLNVTEVTTSILFLNWTKPVGNSFFYKVLWTDGNSTYSQNVTVTYVKISNLTPGVQYNVTVITVAGDNQTQSDVAAVSPYTKPEVVTDLTVTEVTTSFLLLNWTKPVGNSFFYYVQWTDGNSTNSQNVTVTYVNITNLTPGVQYNVTVITVAGDNQTQSDVVAFSHFTRPGQIGAPTVNQSTSIISLTWTSPSGQVFQYKVVWQSNGAPTTTYTSINSVVLSNLASGTLYTITISGVAGDNQTEGNPYTLMSFTRPQMPQNITVTGRGTNTLSINWTLPSGRVDSYVANISDLSQKYLNSSTTNLTAASFTFLYPGRIHLISVTAVAGSFSNTSGLLQFATVPNPPANITISQRTNSSLSLQWPTPFQMESAPNISYAITYQPQGGVLETQVSLGNSTNLLQLLSGTSYSITVATVGPQNLTSTIVFGSYFTLPNPVETLTASPQSNTSILVTWYNPLGYQSYYKYLVNTSTNSVFFNQTVSTNNANVSNLTPGTAYNVSVTTIAAEGSISTGTQTFSYTMPNAVTGLAATVLNTTTVLLTWARQSDKKDSYSYEVIALDGATVVQDRTTITENYTFFGLTSGKLYTFNVFTVVAGVKSTVQTTLSYTWPDVVSKINAIGSTTNMSVSWTLAAGQVDTYNVMLYRNSSAVQPMVMNLSNTTVNTQFQGLTPGVVYCVVVVSKRGPVSSNSSSICNATFPNPPGPITVVSQTVYSINFTWQYPGGMDYSQYSFIVFTANSSVLITSNSYLLASLQPGSLYNISVVTLGILSYTSTAVTAQNYTRPNSVINLQQTQITTNSVTLTWVQLTKNSSYSYMVQFTNGSFMNFTVVSYPPITITGLLSGSNYNFTVISQTADYTQAAPVTVSYFTRPYNVTGIKVVTLNTTAVNLSWTQPLEYKNKYTYQVNTTGCGSESSSFPGQVAVISGLTPGTNCTVCVSVRAEDGTEGAAQCLSQYTQPWPVQPSISSQGSNSSVLVSWTSPPGNVEYYEVQLNGTNQAPVVMKALPPNTSVVIGSLSAGTLYSAVVISCSGPFCASSINITNATFPNPPGPIQILTKTTSSISIMWMAAPLMANASLYYHLTIQSAQELDNDTSSTNYTFTPLLSGTSYNICVETVGVMGFVSNMGCSYIITTRPQPVNTVMAVMATVDNITVEWTKPGNYQASYYYILAWQSKNGPMNITTKNQNFIIYGMDPGSQYSFNVITVTSDGTQGDPTGNSSCTNASPVINGSVISPNGTDAKILLSWSKPSGQHTGFLVNVTDTQSGNITPMTSQCCNKTISGLLYNHLYIVTVVTQSCGQSSTSVSLTCTTGITNPPIPSDYASLTTVAATSYNQFSIQIQSRLLNDINGKITQVGVLVAKNPPVGPTTGWNQYLTVTYDQWQTSGAAAYLATVQNTSSLTRSAVLIITLGDGSQWLDYVNGPLAPTASYQYSIVLFTSLIVNGNHVDWSSLVSITPFYSVVTLPQNPAIVTGLAVGFTTGFLVAIFIMLIGGFIYWKRSHTKEPNIPITTMRSKVTKNCLFGRTLACLSRSVPVRVEDYEAYYKKQKADSNCGFATEFEDLKPVGTNQSKAHALNLENKSKNRYNNVLPYDSSRVKLSIVHGNTEDDYINANYMPGYNSRKEFIAAQGPLPVTVKDFWRMIWEKNVQTLVMLTRCNEQGRVKCDQYWSSGTKHYENISVTTAAEIPLEDWTIRDFSIKNVKTAETRLVRQFHFTAWPDHGVPETTELLISFRHLVREHMDQYSKHSPTVVHCSAGVGRTGTFIAIDRLLFQIERENSVDVFGIVHDLRMHRPLMVQTEDQYVFLNQCALDIIRSRTGTNVDLIYQNATALSIYENIQPKKGLHKNGHPL
ncbi:receptor-type tyrosine-protein phosphatase eta [Betta splendens]|uniref:protein-tyrosine-phosphatase n=1 Tax=Betta splendens TaxID=158456 RepID=A0A9W2XVV6_BETSP|nr:receptor-type tyrosine-protein phosphatase eta [Betta splendens]